MLQPPNPSSSSPFPSSPAGSNFTPRKEFIQTPPRQSSVFALLAFSSNNAIRLSNFPQPLVTALRALLDAVIGLRSFRENAEHKLAEIILTGKPWSSPKSLSTEIVLIQVFNVLVAHGYSFVSQLDYGREHNDRLSLVFSRLGPIPGQSIPPRIVTFALSFPSPTVLRVVCPPLHATPAILQSVRGAWPRGVTNEKKLGEGCYEFKLKGYSWFSEDTFPEDALAHTLTILTALDRHDCKLLTSLALTASRPRNKDLWLFSAPGPGAVPPSDADAGAMTESPVHLGSPLKPSTYEPIVDHAAEGSGDSVGSEFMRDGHARSPSDPAAAVLRKRDQQKPAIIDESKHLPSTVHSPPPSHDIVPGPPPDIFYATAPPPPLPPRVQVDTIHVSDLPQRFPRQDPSPEPQSPLGLPPAHPLVSLPEATERHPSDEDFPQRDAHVEADAAPSTTSTPTLHAPDLPTPPLLPPAAFRTPSDEPRDSGYSAATGRSFDVPITWIPTAHAPPPSAFLNVDARTDVDGSSITTGPLPPGGWASTPAIEADDFMAREGASESAGANDTLGENENAMPERQDARAPLSPEIVPPALPDEDAGRKSEAGMLGVMPSPTRENEPPIPPASQANGHTEEDTSKEGDKPKEGWVLVSVGSEEPSAQKKPSPPSTPVAHVAVSAAQLIAAADATESAPSPVPTTAANTKSQSSLGRLFSRSHRKEGRVQKVRSVEREARSEKDKSGRSHRKGGMLQTLRSGKRSTID